MTSFHTIRDVITSCPEYREAVKGTELEAVAAWNQTPRNWAIFASLIFIVGSALAIYFGHESNNTTLQGIGVLGVLAGVAVGGIVTLMLHSIKEEQRKKLERGLDDGTILRVVFGLEARNDNALHNLIIRLREAADFKDPELEVTLDQQMVDFVVGTIRGNNYLSRALNVKLRREKSDKLKKMKAHQYTMGDLAQMQLSLAQKFEKLQFGGVRTPHSIQGSDDPQFLSNLVKAHNNIVAAMRGICGSNMPAHIKDLVVPAPVPPTK